MNNLSLDISSFWNFVNSLEFALYENNTLYKEFSKDYYDLQEDIFKYNFEIQKSLYPAFSINIDPLSIKNELALVVSYLSCNVHGELSVGYCNSYPVRKESETHVVFLAKDYAITLFDKIHYELKHVARVMEKEYLWQKTPKVGTIYNNEVSLNFFSDYSEFNWARTHLDNIKDKNAAWELNFDLILGYFFKKNGYLLYQSGITSDKIFVGEIFPKGIKKSNFKIFLNKFTQIYSEESLNLFLKSNPKYISELIV